MQTDPLNLEAYRERICAGVSEITNTVGKGLT